MTKRSVRKSTPRVSKRTRRFCRVLVDYMRRKKKPRDYWDFAYDEFKDFDVFFVGSILHALVFAGVIHFDFNVGWFLLVKTRKPFTRLIEEG